MFETGVRLRLVRKQANLTLDQLAGLSGIDRGTISRIELGHVSPRVDTIKCLCAAMEITLAGFFMAEPKGTPDAPSAVEMSPFLDPALGATPYWPIPGVLWQSLVSVAERFEVLLANSGELVMVLDTEGRIAYLSPGGRSLMGFRDLDILGVPVLSLVHPEDQNRFRTMLSGPAPGSATSRGFRLQHRDGPWVAFDCTFTDHRRTPAIQAVILNATPVQTA